MKPKYYLENNEFVIEQYNNAKPFASFLPGIAGLYGKPLWAFFANRGQCIASFGRNAKDEAIMEFYPATTAFRRVSLEGFRTFLKWRDGGKKTVYEPFRLYGTADAHAPRQTLYVSPHEVRIEEVSHRYGIVCEAVYFTVPGEDFPALARTLRIRNLAKRSRRIEIIDGMPKLCPYGLNEWFMKHMSNTIEAWMMVTGIAEKRPFYRLRVDAADVAETKYITSGHFYLSRLGAGGKGIPVVVDPAVVFGASSDLVRPDAFSNDDFSVPRTQIDKNITPAAFSYAAVSLPAGKETTVHSLIGYADSEKHLTAIDRQVDAAFFREKRAANRAEITRIASSVSVFSAHDVFDAYVRQTNLDNILRGGMPIRVGKDGAFLYVFNRKHGDLERDYNNFVVRAEHYAQGNGNYRDANQNRRLSVWCEPALGTKDIQDFYELVQLDGYNPLVIKGDRFSIARPADRKRIARTFFPAARRKTAEEFLAGAFTAGDLFAHAVDVKTGARRTALLDAVAAVAECSICADHGEGYWVDHWTYNLDLIESYLALFPEKKADLLFGEATYRFFDSDHVVRPRAEKTVRKEGGEIRQYGAVAVDPEKRDLIAAREQDRQWVRTGGGRGRVYRCALAVKMLVIIANKIATLDPEGIGIEMEADKPGWCDSMNGLPGLFGSSYSETFELARLVRFFVQAVDEAGADGPGAIRVPAEVAAFLRGLTAALSVEDDRRYWEKANDLKERYRAAVRLGLQGKEVRLDAAAVRAFLRPAAAKLDRAIGRMNDPQGIPYTYCTHEVTGLDKKGRPKAFRHKQLPLFLEAVVHALKVQPDTADARALYRRVRKSPLYDAALGMYKLNASLAGESLEVGRSRAFTPGWLENESVWLHMEYKYLLELLRNGLVAEFHDDMRRALIPFGDAGRYGRSILENSSFIASSAFFDRNLVGNGFYARLSGATVEFLHMLQLMNLGTAPFTFDGESLAFAPRPLLTKDFFAPAERQIDFGFRQGSRRVKLPRASYAFSIFGATLIIYENPLMKDTFGPAAARPVRFVLRYLNGREKVVLGSSLGSADAADLRAGKIDTVRVLFQ